MPGRLNRRAFLTRSSLAPGTTLASVPGCDGERQEPRPAPAADPGATAGVNWAGNLDYHAPRFYQPTTVAEAQALVAESPKIRPLGTRHCFNRIADSREAQISVRALPRIVEIDEAKGTATIDAGASYGQVCEALDARGYALPNLASLPHISIAGAIATATHGSGADNGNLAAPVSALEFIDAKGDLVTLSRAGSGEAFKGAVVHLGGLGLLTKVTLDLVPAFEMRQHVYLDLPAAAMRERFDELMGSGYSVSLFTDYRDDRVKQVWRKQRADNSEPDAERDFFGAAPATRNRHPADAPAEVCTDQLGVAGPWYDRLPHFKMGFTPSSGKELQTEYFVPREHSVAAYQAITELAGDLAPVLIISEVRLVAADDLWMSTAYGQPTTAFHFTWQPHRDGVRRVAPMLDRALAPFGAVPHWGKVFTLSPAALQSRHARLDDFKDLLAAHDPNGKFRNAYLEYYLYGSETFTVDDMW